MLLLEYTLHIWLNKTIFYCDGHFDKHSNMPQAMQLIVQLKKQPWIQKRNLLLFESMAFHQLRILYYCINCAKISIRVFSRFLILFLFDDLNYNFDVNIHYLELYPYIKMNCRNIAKHLSVIKHCEEIVVFFCF